MGGTVHRSRERCTAPAIRTDQREQAITAPDASVQVAE